MYHDPRAGRWVLKISPVQRRDGGLYECQVTQLSLDWLILSTESLNLIDFVRYAHISYFNRFCPEITAWLHR